MSTFLIPPSGGGGAIPWGLTLSTLLIEEKGRDEVKS